MIALALALAVAAQPASKVEPWILDAYCYVADQVDLIGYEQQKRQAPGEGKAALDARYKALIRQAIESGASRELVERQMRLFEKNLSTLRLIDRARFDRQIADCRIAT
jgi:predicted RNA-binding protein